MTPDFLISLNPSGIWGRGGAASDFVASLGAPISLRENLGGPEKLKREP